MNSLLSLSPEKLRRAADIREELLGLEGQLEAMLNGAGSAPAVSESILPARGGLKLARRRRKLSPEGLANIRAGVLKRQAARLAAAAAGGAKAKAARPVSAKKANLARSLAAKARWAKAKASGRSRW